MIYNKAPFDPEAVATTSNYYPGHRLFYDAFVAQHRVQRASQILKRPNAMKLNKTLKALLATSVLAAAACTANYEDINRNPYEVSGDEMDRDGYAMRSFLTTMQSWVVPTDVNQCQFTDILLAGVYGGYFADANADFNSNSFATYLPATNWSEVFYETIYQRIIANYFELLDITTDENAIAVAKVIKVMGLSRVADVYGPIPIRRWAPMSSRFRSIRRRPSTVRCSPI